MKTLSSYINETARPHVPGYDTFHELKEAGKTFAVRTLRSMKMLSGKSKGSFKIAYIRLDNEDETLKMPLTDFWNMHVRTLSPKQAEKFFVNESIKCTTK